MALSYGRLTSLSCGPSVVGKAWEGASDLPHIRSALHVSRFSVSWRHLSQSRDRLQPVVYRGLSSFHSSKLTCSKNGLPQTSCCSSSSICQSSASACAQGTPDNTPVELANDTSLLPRVATVCTLAAAITLALPFALAPLYTAHAASVSSFFASVSAAATTTTASSLSFSWPEVIRAAWAGLLAGCLHTLTGPDHLAALAPLTIGRTRVQAAFTGALWGCGHDAGQLLFGALFLLLRDRLKLDVLRVWGSRVVGLTLLAIGALGINESRATAESELAAVAEGTAAPHSHTHPHSPVPAAEAASPFGLATFATGVVHGLQPDALLVILPALAMPSRAAGAAFLLLFLLGTVLAMGSYTAFIGSASTALKEKVPGLTLSLSWLAAVLAIALGVAILASELLGFHLL